MFSLFSAPKRPLNSDPIYLYNSSSRKKEVFKSIKAGEISMYSCGPTVYNHIHIGNLRAYLVPDLLRRLFLYNGYHVKSTINFTDFGHLSDDADAGEDKMVKGMRREGLPITLEAMRGFAEPYIESFKKDNIAFGNLPPTNYTRASDYIKEQIKLIQTLEEKGYTYKINDGVYFDISKFPNYGELGNINLEELKAGARVEVNSEKRQPADFALWKNGDLGWPSRWGIGFPGWHIECTAMAFATLGKQIDIHTGGEDLMYTHHNGEIAQAECITGKKFVSYWLHNAHITIHNQKIAKSSGNGLNLSELQNQGFSPADYRYWLLTSHYRTTSNFSLEALESSKQALVRLQRFVYEELDDVKPIRVNDVYETNFLTALHDDLDTPKAIAILWDLVKDDSISHAEKLATIHACDSLLEIGLSKTPAEGKVSLGYVKKVAIPVDVQTLIEEREVARRASNWAEADRLREAISVQGYTIKDTPSGFQISKI